jgi:hypothetical protein
MERHSLRGDNSFQSMGSRFAPCTCDQGDLSLLDRRFHTCVIICFRAERLNLKCEMCVYLIPYAPVADEIDRLWTYNDRGRVAIMPNGPLIDSVRAIKTHTFYFISTKNLCSDAFINPFLRSALHVFNIDGDGSSAQFFLKATNAFLYVALRKNCEPRIGLFGVLSGLSVTKLIFFFKITMQVW